MSEAGSNHGVVVTGLGLISGLGIGVEAFWEELKAGRSGIRPVQAFDASAFRCQFAAETPAFKAKDFVPKKQRKATKVMARDIELAVAAAMLAVRDAGVVTVGSDPDGEPTHAPSRCGAQIGAGVIAAEVNELTEALNDAREPDGTFTLKLWGERGMGGLTPLWLLKYLPNMLACHVTIAHDCRGPSNTITCGEASALLSIGESMRVIERGDADLCFSGGAESKVNLLHMMRQEFLGKTAAAADAGIDGATLVRPFNAEADDRDGGVIGEGGGIVIVESKDAAARRNAKPYVELIGFGSSIASHIDPETGALWSGPARDGRGIRAAVENALDDAGLSAGDIDLIVPNGSGIHAWDQAELAALQAVFDGRLADVPMATTRPFIGNCGAGTGGFDLAVAALALKHQHLPGRLHGGTPVDGLQVGAAAAGDRSMATALVVSVSECGESVAVVARRA
jgi:3-oxoacyl-[acyl-carrier-protein] synthase II